MSLPVIAALLSASLLGTPGSNGVSEGFGGFIRNDGQWAGPARFMAPSSGMNLWVTDNGPAIDLYKSLGTQVAKDGTLVARRQNHPIYVTLGEGRAEGVNRQKPVFNYYGPEGAIATGVPLYGEVWVRDVQPGVDARYYLEGSRPRYDLVLKPGVDPASVAMHYQGASNLRVVNNALTYDTPLGTVMEKGLFAYQVQNGRKVQVAASPMVKGNGLVGFRLGAFNRNQPLVIDPVVYFQQVGSSGNDTAVTSAPDGASGVLVGGTTVNSVYPGQGGSVGAVANGFVSRYDSTGVLQWYTMFITDTATPRLGAGGGNAYFAAYSTAWPRSATHIATTGRVGLSSLDIGTGTLIESRRFGTITGTATVGQVAVSAAGEVAVVGSTTAKTTFGTTAGALQTAAPTVTAINAGWISKFSTALARTYGTYYAGGTDSGLTGAVYSGTDLYVSGTVTAMFKKNAQAGNLIPGIAQADLFLDQNSGNGIPGTGAFVTKLAAANTVSRVNVVGGFTYNGGINQSIDAGALRFNALALAGDGSVIAVGNQQVSSTDTRWSSTPSPFTAVAPNVADAASNANLKTATDAYIVKFTTAFDGLDWSRVFGGTGNDSLGAVSVVGNEIYAGGSTVRVGYPGSVSFLDFGASASTTITQGLITDFSLTGSPLYGLMTGSLGGSLNSLSAGPLGSVYIAGTVQGNYATGTSAGGSDLLVTRMNFLPVLAPSTVTSGASSYTVWSGDSDTFTVTLNRAADVNETITLSSNNANATVPASIVIPAGSSSGTFTVNFTPVAVSTPVTISATLNAVTATKNITLEPMPALASVTGPSNVAATGGLLVTHTVNLDKVADRPVTVTLGFTPTAPWLGDVTVPASVTVPQGSSSATFDVTVNGGVPLSRTNTINGTFNAVTQSNVLSLDPPALASIVLPAVTPGGVEVNGTVTLAAPAGPLGQMVRFLVNKGGPTVPTAEAFAVGITIPAGSSSGTFRFKNTPVVTDTTYTVLCGPTSTNILVRLPIASSVVPLVSSAFSGERVIVRGYVDGKVATGASVFLTAASDNLAAPISNTGTYPNPRQVAANYTFTNFEIVTGLVTTDQTVNVTIGSATGSFLLKAPVVTSGVFDNATRTAGSPSAYNFGRFNIGSKAPIGGVPLTLSVQAGNVDLTTFPTTLTVAPGSMVSPSFKVRTIAGYTGPVTIRATFGSTFQDITYQVVP